MIIIMSFWHQHNILQCDKRSATQDVGITEFRVYNEQIYPKTLGYKFS